MSDAASDLNRVRDYLVGRMSDEEKIALEDRVARDPVLAGEFEQSLQLREGLRQLEAQGYFAPPAPSRRVSRRVGIQRWVSAAAAAVIAAVGFGLWWQVTHEQASVLIASRATSTGTVTSPVIAHFTFIAMRDATRPNLTLPPRGLIELRAAPGMLTGPSYRIALVREKGRGAQTLGTVTGVALGPDGYLHCYADSSLLKPGSYLLRVESEGPAGGAEVYPLTLRSAERSPAP